jgi:hypothetical protein
LNAEVTEPEKETEESAAQPTGLAATLEKAAPVNEQERAKGQKRRVKEEDEEDDVAKMEMDSDSASFQAHSGLLRARAKEGILSHAPLGSGSNLVLIGTPSLLCTLLQSL